MTAAACNKMMFTSRADAKAYVRRAWTGKRTARPYECPRCGAWHLTSRTRRDGRQMRKRWGL